MRTPRHARLTHKTVAALQFKLVAVTVAAATVMACGAFAAVHVHPAARASAGSAAPSVTEAAPPARASLAAHPADKAAARLRRKLRSQATSRQTRKSAHKRSPDSTAKPARKSTAKPTQQPTATASPTATGPATPANAPTSTPTSAPPAISSARKGVSTVNFTGVSQALSESGASWYYNWAPTPDGIPAPSSVPFVPMIWNAADVTAANLDAAKQESSDLLAFNEPDMGGQANMSPQQALDLWPQLEATGMTLGSPAVSSGAATPGGWLDQFMAGAKADGYRVNFIAVHWYGGDFTTASAVQELKSYLQAIYARYHLPIWLTEFALIGYDGATAIYPTDDQQSAFLTSATAMLDGLSYVQRYAWFSLPTANGFGDTGLFDPGPAVTEVGRAFEAAS